MIITLLSWSDFNSYVKVTGRKRDVSNTLRHYRHFNEIKAKSEIYNRNILQDYFIPVAEAAK